MKLIILLAVVASASCAKLDRTYLPPHAQTSGGSANILDTPNFEPSFSSKANGAQATFAQINPAQGNSYQAQRPQVNIARENVPSNFGSNSNGFPEPNAFGPASNFASDNFVPANNFATDNFAPQANNANDDTISVDSFDNNPGSFNPSYNNPGSDAFERPERPRAALDRNAAILRMDSSNDGENFAYAYETDNGISADESGVATNGVEAQGGYSYTGDDGKVYSIRYTADQNGFVPQGDHLPTPPPVPEEILKALEQNARDEAAGIFDDGSYDAEKYGTADQHSANYPTDSNFAPENNFAQNSGSFAPENNFAQNTGNYSPETGFEQSSGNFALENFGQNNNNFAPNSALSNFAQEDDDTVVTNSADEFNFTNQKTPGFRGQTKSQGPAYLPPVRR